MTWRGGASDGDGTPSDRRPSLARRRGVRPALLLLAGIALLQAGVGASLVAGSGDAAPNLTLTSDAHGASLFSASGMAPGRLVERCLRLSYGNAVDDDRLRLMATASGPLADNLVVRVESGSGGNAGSCAGFSGSVVYWGTMTRLRTAHGTEQTALPLRTLSDGNGSMSVRLRFSVANTNAAQGKSATANLVWIGEAVGDRTPPPPVVTPVDPPPKPTPVPSQPPLPPTPVEPAVPAQPAPPPAGNPDPPADPPPAPAPAPTGDAVDPVRPSNGGGTPTTPSLPTLPPAGSLSSGTDPATAPDAPLVGPGDGGEGGPKAEDEEPGGLSGGAQQVGRVFSSGAKAVASVASDLAGSVHEQVFKPMAVAAAPAAKGATIGLGGTAPLLGIFLLIQSRIDRRDPKLALAPVHADPDLTFNEIPRGPLHSRRTPSGEISP